MTEKLPVSGDPRTQAQVAAIIALEAGKKGRRVVCAAVRAEDGSLVLGIRHYSMDMHVQIKQRHDGEKFCNRHGDDQGFVDQWGVYMDRKTAFVVALAAGQIVRPEACHYAELYSEGLY
jgi:hypothetical protein